MANYNTLKKRKTHLTLIGSEKTLCGLPEKRLPTILSYKFSEEHFEDTGRGPFGEKMCLGCVNERKKMPWFSA